MRFYVELVREDQGEAGKAPAKAHRLQEDSEPGMVT